MPTRDNNEAEREARVATILARLERDKKPIIKASPVPARAPAPVQKSKRGTRKATS
ncbi:MAG TPA: hypothetical protein VH701_12035 [Vicinamibacterales bacterium]|jgi:hypothetical protein